MRGAKLFKIIVVATIVPQAAIMMAALYLSYFCDYLPWEICTAAGLQLIDWHLMSPLLEAADVFNPIFIGGQIAGFVIFYVFTVRRYWSQPEEMEA